MYKIFGFYKFKSIVSLKKKKIIIEKIFSKHDVRGTLIISKEGLNGTISGKLKKINIIKKEIKKLFSFKEFDSQNLSENKFKVFHKPKIKIKKELVPMGILIKNLKKGGKRIQPQNWNALIKKKDILILDARKPFEYEVGSFKNAINPNISNFRDFPKYLNKIDNKKPVAMFCTGGIRCEKASVYLKQNGFKNVYQLKGGILNYLKKIPKHQSLWRGECFVFDNRVSVKHNLTLGNHSICSGCRSPLSKKDKNSKKYELGVSCSRCKDKLTKQQIIRFRMRQKQVDLAKRSGKNYIFQKEF